MMIFIGMPMIEAPATTGAFFVAGMLAIGLYVDAPVAHPMSPANSGPPACVLN